MNRRPHDVPSEVFRLDRLASRRSLLASGGALAVVAIAGLSGTGCAQAPAGPPLRSSDFASFADAVAKWASVGGTLVVDVDHVMTQPVTMGCVAGLDYRLVAEGVRTIAYAGPQFHWQFCIYSPGRNGFGIQGDLTFDGRAACSIPVFARFETVAGSDRRDMIVDGLKARNARMKRGTSRIDGSRTNAYGATAMLFSGGFDHLVLRNVAVADVTREAGAGLTGSQGCVGIGVTGNLAGTQSARHVTIEDFTVERVDSDDPPGSPRRGDMDGVLVFQSAETGGTRPIIRRGTIREAAGRAIKVFAPGGGGLTRDIAVHRSVHGVTGGSNDIAHQHGDGTIENVTFHYSGDAHSQPTTPIGMSAGHLRDPRFPFARGIIRDIRMRDTTGQSKRTLATLFFNLNDPTPRSYLLTDIVDDGTAESLFNPGGLGSTADATIEISRVSVALSAALMLTEDYDRRLTVRASDFTNRGARPVPFKAAYNRTAMPRGHGGRLIVTSSVRGLIP